MALLVKRNNTDCSSRIAQIEKTQKFVPSHGNVQKEIETSLFLLGGPFVS